MDPALVHNLAQYVHSKAQGKVGSGFDVSAAVYGSHVYNRFSPTCFGDLMDLDQVLYNLMPIRTQLMLSCADYVSAPTCNSFTYPQ